MRVVATIPALVRQHAQDAAFLFAQRAREVEGPRFGEADLGRRDARLCANLDGLLAAGRAGWEVAREEAAAEGGAGGWFALAALAFEAGPAEADEALALALQAGRAGERGLSGAAAWTPPPRLGERESWLGPSEQHSGC